MPAGIVIVRPWFAERGDDAPAPVSSLEAAGNGSRFKDVQPEGAIKYFSSSHKRQQHNFNTDRGGVWPSTKSRSNRQTPESGCSVINLLTPASRLRAPDQSGRTYVRD